MGIEIESPGSVVRGNRVSGSVNTGIFITSYGSPSNVHHNTVFGSGLVDMLDEQLQCGSNTWTGNNFVTDLVADVPNGAKVPCLKKTPRTQVLRPLSPGHVVKLRIPIP